MGYGLSRKGLGAKLHLDTDMVVALSCYVVPAYGRIANLRVEVLNQAIGVDRGCAGE